MPSKAQWDAAMGITSSAFLAPGVFKTGDYVYLRSDVTGASKDLEYKPYLILEQTFETDASGNILDSTGATADGTQSPNVATDGSTPDTHAQFPHFYDIQETFGNQKRIRVHETQLLNITGANFVKDAAGADWADPA